MVKFVNFDLHLKNINEIAGSQNVLTDVSLKQYTSFKIGGPAAIMVFPACTDMLVKTLKYLIENNINRLLIGNGTNLLVSDKGFNGVVIHTAKNMKSVSVEGEYITAQCGALMSSIASTALSHSLSGLEFASGIPGTLGGALYMNAGAYDCNISDIALETKAMDEQGNIINIVGLGHQFGYRTSCFKSNGLIIVESKLKLSPSDYDIIKEKMKDLNIKRKTCQPLEFPSAGSVFKRPVGYYAGKLIEDTGLKGCSIGGACVSEKHAGFIINKGNATAEDVNRLINHIIEKVYCKYGVVLEPEIIRIGEF